MATLLSQIASGGAIAESIEPEIVSESDMACLLTIALEDVCNDEELEELRESVESGKIVLMPVEERSIVKLDKKAKKEKAYRLSLYQVAKEHNDPNYLKLQTLWKAERILLEKIEKKWHNKAKQRMKEMKKQASSSSSSHIKKAGSKSSDGLTRSQRRTQKALAGGAGKMDGQTKSRVNAITKKLGVDKME